MTLTKKQMEILNFITENEDAIKQLKNIANTELTGLKIKDSVNIAGITWSKFGEDENGNSLMLADESVCKMSFGDDNNWTNSAIREKCRDIAEELKKELGEAALVEFETDLFSHDGLRDYGKVHDEVAILTYDIYRNNRENIKLLDNWYWLATPDSTPSGCGSGSVRCVDSGGDVDYYWCGFVRAVRPFFILKS